PAKGEVPQGASPLSFGCDRWRRANSDRPVSAVVPRGGAPERLALLGSPPSSSPPAPRAAATSVGLLAPLGPVRGLASSPSRTAVRPFASAVSRTQSLEAPEHREPDEAAEDRHDAERGRDPAAEAPRAVGDC